MVRRRLVILVQLETIVLCLVASFRFINLQSTVILSLFLAFFASLMYYLNGSVVRKLSILTIGSALGLFWSLAFYHFAAVGASVFGEPFEAFYVMISPFLNLMWIVPFWSYSLSALPKIRSSR